MPLPALQKTYDATALLDDFIPLRDASHADVVEYCVEIPTRYAQCVALLTDGRKVTLAQPHKFIGWSSHSASRSLLFRNSEATLEIGVTDSQYIEKQPAALPGKIRSIIFDVVAPRCASTMKKFIGTDGGLIFQPAA